MSHPVTSSTHYAPTAVTALRPEVAERPPASRQTPQTVSILEPASSAAPSGMGFFRRIANKWITFWNAVWACITGWTRPSQGVAPITASEDTARASAALARRIEKGNTIIDRFFREYRGQDANRQVAFFTMRYNQQTVICFRKVNQEGQMSIDAFVKMHLKQLLSSEVNAIIDNDFLQISTWFFERRPNEEIVCNPGHLSMSMFDYYTLHGPGNPAAFDNPLTLSSRDFPELISSEILLNDEQKHRIIECVMSAGATT